MPTTANRGYSTPAYNSQVGLWGTTDLNGNFTLIDANISGITTVSLSNANVTLTSVQAQNLTIYLSGTLSANVTVSTPCIGFFWIVNNTTGSYIVNIQANFGSGAVGSAISVPQGTRQLFVSDTTYGLQYGAVSPGSGVPAGSLQAYAGPFCPSGWLFCYGQAINRIAYSALYTAIGTIYGTGDGSTTFNVPDLRGRTIFGLDNMGGSAAGRLTGANTGNIVGPTILGATGGEENHTSTITETPSHNHALTDPGHAHNYVKIAAPGTGLAGGGNAGLTTVTTDSATTGITMANTGGGGSHNTIPPGMTVNWLIKAF